MRATRPRRWKKTRLWAKKYLGVGAYDGNNLIQTVSYFYGGPNNRQQGLNNDLILIRMADVYLMHSELTETNTYLNKVRERAKLPGGLFAECYQEGAPLRTLL